MGRHPNNKVWEYFDFISDRFAKCRSCKAKISTPGSSRGNMVRHLFQLHGINTYTAGPKVGLVLNNIPSKRGREFDECLKEGRHRTFKRLHQQIRESNSGDVEYEADNDVPIDDDNKDQYEIKSNNESENYYSHQILDEENSDAKIPTIKVRSDSRLKMTHNDEIDQDHNNVNDRDDNDVLINDPLIDLNVESLEPDLPCNTPTPRQHVEHHRDHHDSPSLNHMPHHLSTSDTHEYIERLKAEALAEKLNAEARYFNELADLTRSKRIYVDLQCQKLRNQLRKS